MRRWALRVAIAGLWAAALVVAAVRHPGGWRGLSAPRPVSVELCGPNHDLGVRLEAKARIANEVIAGRLSLFQAAAVFRDMDREGQRPAGFVRIFFPDAASEDEAYCRSVIGWVGASAPRDRADELTRRLRAELDARLKEGDLRLAEP